MTTAADIMSPGPQWIPSTATLDRAAQLMRELDVGALPVSDVNHPDQKMCGILTDRDIVVGCVAAGHDPSAVTAGELCEGTPRWTTTDTDIEDVLADMEQRRIRRLPVVDGDRRLVGMISEADVARNLSEQQVAAFASRVYAQ